MKIQKYQRRGMVTLLNVVIIGGFLLGLMAVTYRSSIRSLEGQKKVQLLIDYDSRQQSFFRSVVTLMPQYAANTMMDESIGDANATFAGLFSQAASMAKFDQVLTSDEMTAMGFGAHRNGNTGNVSTGYDYLDFVGGGVAGSDGALAVNGGLGATAAAGYPSVMSARDASATSNATVAPLITSDATYDEFSVAGDPRDYGILSYPNIHFGYKNPGDPFITRQNWWKLFVHPRAADIAAVGLGDSTNMADSRFEYIVSVYEVPAQLAVSSAAFLDIGNIGGTGFDDAKIQIEGGIYAKKANVTSGAFDRIATTEGATITAGATIGAQDGTVDRATYEATSTEFYPISKASDYARSIFIPINPGFEFFDRFANTATGNNRYSADSWYEYSRGCQQCVMKVDVIEVANAADQAPLTLRFTNGAYSVNICKPSSSYRVGAYVDWPAADDGVFPFVVGAASADAGTPSLAIHMDRLEVWLQTADGGNVAAADIGDSNSIVVNGDYTIAGTNVVQPSQGNSPMHVQLYDCDDLTSFTSGFSIVSAYNVEILDDFNITQFGAGGYPATSIFAPQVSYGIGQDDTNDVGVTVYGSLASMNNTSGNTAVELFQLQNASGGAASVAETKAELSAVETLEDLPPINMMNWLVLVQKQGM